MPYIWHFLNQLLIKTVNMMRNLLLTLLVGIMGAMSFAQTIVSTSPENKKVILEEFTGIHCVYCPDGHAIAQAIQDNNPGEVFLINIHVGSFAVPGSGEPDFRTPFGTAIANQSQLVGYPAGTVNRHFFPGRAQNGGSGTAMSRNWWTISATETLAESSYLNMAVEADIDVQTNELTVHVEAYYTGTSPQATNKLNVALLQDNTLGPQTGGNMGTEYNHMHRLIHMVTGQWGDEVSPTTSGSFIDRTYSYTIPESHNNVPIEIEDLQLVVFMTETNQELISGNGAAPTYSNFEFQNDATAVEVDAIADQCGFELAPQFLLQNTGENPITSVDITYSINDGTVHNYTWTGNLTSLQSEMVSLPAVTYDVQEVNTIEINIQNDDNNANNVATLDFNKTFDFTNEVTMLLNTDNQGSQCTWEIIDVDGNTLESGGPYGNNESIQLTFDLPGNCYQFNLYDSGNNGGGSVVMFDADSNVIFNTNGDYGSGESVYFSTQGFLGTGSNAFETLAIYPNPANNQITIQNAENASVAIYDILGKRVMTTDQISQTQVLNVSQLKTGTYFVSITKDQQTTVQKLIITK